MLDAAFLAKKLLGALVLPSTAGLVAVAVALLLLCLGRRRSGRLLLIAAATVLLAGSLRPVAHGLMGPLERAYPVLTPADIPSDLPFVVVIGGPQLDDPALPATARAFPDGTARMAEAVRLLRTLPGATLVLTGYSRTGGQPVALMHAELAGQLGVPADRIVTLPEPRDTAEEAAVVRRVVGTRPFVLLTAAFHLPRAVSTFRVQGLDPIPYPTAQRVPVSWSATAIEAWLPRASYLATTDLAVREYIGSLWYCIRSRGGCL